MTWKGKLVRVDLGTGGWVLETSGGKIALFGDVPNSLAGCNVEVKGKEMDGAGFLMVGDKMIEVEHIAKAG